MNKVNCSSDPRKQNLSRHCGIGSLTDQTVIRTTLLVGSSLVTTAGIRHTADVFGAPDDMGGARTVPTSCQG